MGDPTLVVDLGDVACRFRPDRRMLAVAAASGLGPHEIERRWWGSGLEARCERGELGLGQVYAELRRALSVELADAELRRIWSLAFEPDPGVLALLAAVQAPTALFTNNGPIVTDCLDHELVTIRDRFDQCVFSWQLGCRKPAIEAFRGLVEELGVEPNMIVFADDNPANVEGAEAVGIDAIRFVSARQLGVELGRRQLLP